MNREMNVIAPGVGLHRIKGRFQKKFMGAQCDALVAVLDATITTTRECAPVRTRPYLVESKAGTQTRGAESGLERRLFDRWGPHEDSAPHSPGWTRLLGF